MSNYMPIEVTDPNYSIDYNYTFDHIVRSELFPDLHINFRQFTGFVDKYNDIE